MKIGDVVTTTAHNYRMCVREINENRVVCNYFDDTKELHTETYSKEELTIR